MACPGVDKILSPFEVVGGISPGWAAYEEEGGPNNNFHDTQTLELSASGLSSLSVHFSGGNWPAISGMTINREDSTTFATGYTGECTGVNFSCTSESHDF